MPEGSPKGFPTLSRSPWRSAQMCKSIFISKSILEFVRQWESKPRLSLVVNVLHLGSICELSGAPSENRRIVYRQNEVQETQLSLFPIYRSSQAGRQSACGV